VPPLRRRRPLEGVPIMCAKRHRRCAVLLAIREEALQEWIRAETYSDVCRAWGRLGGRVTLHRYGRKHFAKLAKGSRDRSWRPCGCRRRGRPQPASTLPPRAGVILIGCPGFYNALGRAFSHPSGAAFALRGTSGGETMTTPGGPSTLRSKALLRFPWRSAHRLLS
jgi:hypothetical protein